MFSRSSEDSLLAYLCRFAVRAPPLSLAAFLASVKSTASLLVFQSASQVSLRTRTSLRPSLPACPGSTINRVCLSFCVPASVMRISVVLESLPVVHRLRLYVLGLGPDLPWVDEPSPGNLRLSTAQILTGLSLLIPAFSLPCSPHGLPVVLQPACIAPLPIAPKCNSTASVSGFSPVNLRRRITRPVSYYALFE